MTVVDERVSMVRILSGRGSFSWTRPRDTVGRGLLCAAKGAIVEVSDIFLVGKRRLRNFHFPEGLRGSL